ncbi:methyltransferase [Stenotrophomonas maltophilia JV3]|nr:methyltransferase [Stenotrophomonas maltophilia JV3]
MFTHQTSPDTGNATSSAELPVGPLQLDLLGGPTTASCGPAAPRASRSPSRVKAKPRMTIGTCGPTSFASSVPDGPLSSWENRLRRRLARTGSTECLLTWKQRTTPAGRSLSQLVPSMRPTGATASGLWPTPAARDWRSEKATDEFYQAWASSPKGKTLPMQIALAMWATPTSLAPAKNGNNEAGNSAGLVAIRAHALAALWPTPCARDHMPAHSPEYIAEKKAQGHGMAVLPDYVQHAPLGTAPAGSSATTENSGALNPAFVCWLMGFLPEWDVCAPTATPSSRKSRQK